jgi:hypothetical protein
MKLNGLFRSSVAFRARIAPSLTGLLPMTTPQRVGDRDA